MVSSAVKSNKTQTQGNPLLERRVKGSCMFHANYHSMGLPECERFAPRSLRSHVPSALNPATRACYTSSVRVQQTQLLSDRLLASQTCGRGFQHVVCICSAVGMRNWCLVASSILRAAGSCASFRRLFQRLAVSSSDCRFRRCWCVSGRLRCRPIHFGS